MGLRCFCVLAILVGLTPSAFATEQPGVARRASCSVVRYYVARYSVAAAEQWARSNGMSEGQIEAARRCLKGTTMRTAQG
jgi:hypothetical protein